MLVKILGGIDIICGILLILLTVTDFPNKVLVISSFLLIAKSLLGMLKDFGSWIDFICALLLIGSIIINFPSFILIIGAILIIQKGIFSFF